MPPPPPAIHDRRRSKGSAPATRADARKQNPARADTRGWSPHNFPFGRRQRLWAGLTFVHAPRMSPFDIAVFAMPISFIIAILPGPSGMALPSATDLAMFSLVQAIIAADAGLIASTAAIVAAEQTEFSLCFSLAAPCCA